jgi:acetyl esterase/lipase
MMPTDNKNNAMAELDVTLPGRLGNPEMTLFDDPRLDPRILQAFASMVPPSEDLLPPALTIDPSYQESLNFVGYMHRLMCSQYASAEAQMPLFSNINSSQTVIPGPAGNDIDLFIDRPNQSLESLPCIVHLHGGGMSFDSAKNPHTVRWRKSLAQMGTVVIGVEFSSETLGTENQPFPNGLNDCAAAVRWAEDNKDQLGISSLIVIGESGGGNLAVATAIKANIEGWIDAIDGIYAMAPMILGFYGGAPPNLMSWRENLNYQGSLEMIRAMTKVYDPLDQHETNPMAWPFHASEDCLRGLPPHMILNYELDLIRDDGITYARNLRAAGVEATSVTVAGIHHVPEIAMPDAVPELTRDTIASIVAFAKGCVSRKV